MIFCSLKIRAYGTFIYIPLYIGSQPSSPSFLPYRHTVKSGYQQLSSKPDESVSSVVSNKIKQGSELAENVELEVKLREIR